MFLESEIEDMSKNIGMEYPTLFFVMQKGRTIEDEVTSLICQLLGIDPYKSEVIGYKGGTMGFHKMVTLISEVLEDDEFEDVRANLKAISNIRNGFAHTHEYNSFRDFFPPDKPDKYPSSHLKSFGNGDFEDFEEQCRYQFCKMYWITLDRLKDLQFKDALTTSITQKASKVRLAKIDIYERELAKHFKEEDWIRVTNEVNRVTRGVKE